MTLTISFLTPTVLYQSSDFCLSDPITRETIVDRGQKSVMVTHFDWSALVAFAGVARTKQIDVGKWLGDQVVHLPKGANLHTVIERLLAADSWLGRVPLEWRALTFSVLAFDGARQSFTLITNVDHLSGVRDVVPSARLRVERSQPSRPKVFVAGAMDLPRPVRRRLEHLSEKPPVAVSRAIAESNAQASDHLGGRLVSRSCVVSYLERSGRGVTMPFGTEVESQDFLPAEIEALFAHQGVNLVPKLDDDGQPMPIKLVQMASQRSADETMTLMELQARIDGVPEPDPAKGRP